MVRLENISNQYEGREILKDVTLSMGYGDFLVLFGADDAGKTTLLHILLGFNTSYSGKVLLMGKRPNQLSAVQMGRVRFVPDDLIMEPGLTGADYLLYAKKAAQDYDIDLQWELCEEFALPFREELSAVTWQQNKLVQVIAAVCARPKLLILDEPGNFLEGSVYRALLGHLEQWNKEGMGILLAAEHYEDAGGYGSRYAYLKEGKLAADKKVMPQDMRGKIVTVAGGDAELIGKYLKKCLRQDREKSIYYYKGNMRSLSAVLYMAECRDWTVEELSLREELEQDFGRWE